VVTAGMLMLGNGTPVRVVANREQGVQAKGSDLQKGNLEKMKAMRDMAPASRSVN
jgi:hypothetical protein